MAHRPDLLAELVPLFASDSREAWLKLLQHAGVPAGPVNSLGDALNDPQVVHNELITTLAAGTDGPAVPTVGLPMRFDGQRPPVRRTAPALGEHTDEILNWLKEN